MRGEEVRTRRHDLIPARRTEMGIMQKEITITDVAKRAGVVVSTVSRVINNKDKVSPKTREAVMRAIEELGYVRNNIAASMKTGHTSFIVVVVPDIKNEFYTAVIRGVETEACKHGYYTIVYTAEENNVDPNLFAERFGHVVDGVIFVPSMAGEPLRKSMNKPIVIIDRKKDDEDIYSVVVDNYKGACQMMEELIRHGHERIGFIYGDSEYTVATDRLRGYLDTLKKYRIPIREAYICKGDWQEATGVRFTREMLALPEPPTAIFAANNQICLGSAQYLMDMGIRIGKEISLVEFDDALIARYLGPGITSIAHPTAELGRRGARMLIALMEDREADIEEKNVVMGVELIRRNSIATLCKNGA